MNKKVKIEWVGVAGITKGREIDILGREGRDPGDAVENDYFLSLQLKVSHFSTVFWVRYHLDHRSGFSIPVRKKIMDLEGKETTHMWEKRIKDLMRMGPGDIISIDIPDRWTGGPIKNPGSPIFLFDKRKINDIRKEVGEAPFGKRVNSSDLISNAVKESFPASAYPSEE